MTTVGLALATVATAFGVTHKSAPHPLLSPAPAATAQIRIWKGEFPSGRRLHVTFSTTGKKPTAGDLGSLDRGYHFTEYTPVPAADLQLEVTTDLPTTTSLKSFPVHFTPNGLATLLLRENGGTLETELVDDSPPPSNANVPELAIRNFVPTLTGLQIAIGEDVRVALHSPDSYLLLRGLKPEVLQVDTSGQQEPGKPLRWTNEVDFRRCRKATLLIYPDPYGRIRPRLIAGVAPETSTADAAGATR